MSSLGWNVLLLAWKWALILLVYAVLLIVLFSVRREMAQKAGQKQARPVLATGRLQVIQPGTVARLYPGSILDLRPDNRLGAEADNDIVLEGAHISGHHARIRWDSAAWWVEDLDSRNGTFIAGKPCLSHTPQSLPPGIPMQVGDAIFELVEAE
jgi:pSer/pThr/pTyr-binding forkhead associated (FHA) protein